MNKILPRSCAIGRRCMDWRKCKYCAGVRQFEASQKAEKLDDHFDSLYLSVLKPHDKTESGIHRIRAALLRRAFAPAGIWSVETGEKMGGLHLNVIAPAPIMKEISDCSTWSGLLNTTARAAAAYINKPDGYPEKAEYAGHLNGSWSRVAGFFCNDRMPATVQAASIEAALSKHQPEHYLRQALAARAYIEGNKPPSREEAREIARRMLPNLYAAIQ